MRILSLSAISGNKIRLCRLLAAVMLAAALLFCVAGCDREDKQQPKPVAESASGAASSASGAGASSGAASSANSQAANSQAANPQAAAAPFVLTVLHTNDVHSNYGGFTEKGLICYAPSCEGGKGGSLRLDWAIRALKSNQKTPAGQPASFVLVDAGDEFQGTLYWTVHENAPAKRILDLIGYDAFVPGNHEFDNGCDPFLDMARSIKVPVLAANVSFKNGHKDADAVRPWTVVEREGRKIGIIGITTEELPSLSSPCPDVAVAPESESLKKAVAELTAQNVDIIIALTHVGLENDKALARSVDGVDVFVGGHSHSLLSGTVPKAEGPYPVIEKSPSGNPVLIVSAANASSYLGVLNITFDAKGVPAAWQGDVVSLDDATLAALGDTRPNPEIAKVVEEFSAPVRAMMQTSIGEILAEGRDGMPLEQTKVLECRAGECLTGNVVADALLAKAFPDAEIVLLNGGALRNSLPGGPVTAGDVLATLPFQNTPLIADVPGSVIKQALEHGVSAYGEGKGGFIQPAGLRYEFDTDKPAGARMVTVEVRGKDGAWSPIDETKTYRVVSVDFLAAGGDGFVMLKGLDWQESDKLISDVLRIYVQTASPIKTELDGRIKIVKR